MSGPTILITAVESSADRLGAGLAGALRQQLGPGLRLVGAGGPALAAAGLQSAFDPAPLAVVGAFNALAAWPAARRLAQEAAALAEREGADVAVLIDAWGFSIRAARALRARRPAMPIVKYVAPQVWASRPGRTRTLAARVDLLLTLNAFDAPYFERAGLKTVFVGSPVLCDPPRGDGARFRRDRGLGEDEPLLLVLPGSRRGEIRRLSRPFGEAVRRLMGERRGLRVAVGVADGMAAEADRVLAGWGVEAMRVEGNGPRADAMAAATVALACSGTVTTELALSSCPMVVAYRLDPLTWLAAKAVIRTPWITLVNVAARAFVAPERVQWACTGARLAQDLRERLDDPRLRATQIEAQTRALDILRGGVEDPAAAAAKAIVELLETRAAPPASVDEGLSPQPRDSSGE